MCTMFYWPRNGVMSHIYARFVVFDFDGGECTYLHLINKMKLNVFLISGQFVFSDN